MSATAYIWLDNKSHSVEGHDHTCTLKFQGKTIWGPATCHSNTFQLADAILTADSRFSMSFATKSHSVEGHTRFISVRASDGSLILNKLSTHDNMIGMISAMYNTSAAFGSSVASLAPADTSDASGEAGSAGDASQA